MAFSFGCTNYRAMTLREKTDAILERAKNRETFYTLLVKMFSLVQDKGLKMIVENPWSEQTYLKANFVMAPSYVDNNRLLRGDYYKKPTAYWFVNCAPTNGMTIQKDKKQKFFMTSKGSPVAGICSEERSMISPDYARNFICDKIIGKPQSNSQLSLFNSNEERDDDGGVPVGAGAGDLQPLPELRQR